MSDGYPIPIDLQPGDVVTVMRPSAHAGRQGTVVEIRVRGEMEWVKVKTTCCGHILEDSKYLRFVGRPRG